jgi:hypothetical protein
MKGYNWILFDLAAQVADINAQQVRICIIIPTPDSIN